MSVHIKVLDDPDRDVYLANRLYFAFEDVVRPRLRAAPDLLELLEVTGLFGGVDIPKLAAESPELASRFARVLFDAAKDVAERKVELPPTSVPYDPNDLQQLFGRLSKVLGQWLQSREGSLNSGAPPAEERSEHPQSPRIAPHPNDNQNSTGSRRPDAQDEAYSEHLGFGETSCERRNIINTDSEDERLSIDPGGRHTDRGPVLDGDRPVCLEVYRCCPGAWRLAAVKLIKDCLGVPPTVVYGLVQSLCNEKKPFRLSFETTPEADGLGQRLAQCGFDGRLMIGGEEVCSYHGKTDPDEC